MKNIINVTPIVFFIVLITGIIYSCSPEKRLNRLVTAHPELVKTDTIKISDTVITAGTEIDTAIPVPLLKDTVIVEKDKLRLRFIEIHDTLFVEAEQIPDTVILTREIPVEKIVSTAQSGQSGFKLIEFFDKYPLPIIIVLILIIVILGFKLNNKHRRNASY
jgi:hypothetical protein